MSQICEVPSCAYQTGCWRPFCSTHWFALSGKTRHHIIAKMKAGKLPASEVLLTKARIEIAGRLG